MAQNQTATLAPTVVVVDDDHAVRTALAFSLELEGYQVQACASGEALLAQSLPTGNACLLLDERLPGMSGLEALAKLRARDVTLPALLITSHPNAALRAAAARARTPILEKPLMGEGLKRAIEQALRQSRSTDDNVG